MGRRHIEQQVKRANRKAQAQVLAVRTEEAQKTDDVMNAVLAALMLGDDPEAVLEDRRARSTELARRRRGRR